MPSRDRRDVRLVGNMAVGCRVLVVAGAAAFVALAYSVPDNCPPNAVACGEGKPLSVFLATPVVLFGAIVVLAGALLRRVGQKR